LDQFSNRVYRRVGRTIVTGARAYQSRALHGLDVRLPGGERNSILVVSKRVPQMVQEGFFATPDQRLSNRVGQEKRGEGHSRVGPVESPNSLEARTGKGAVQEGEFADLAPMAECPDRSCGASPVVAGDGYLAQPKIRDQLVQIIGQVWKIVA